MEFPIASRASARCWKSTEGELRVNLRQALSAGHCLLAPGVYDGLSALLVEQAGFEAAFVSGASVAFARHGLPDLGLVSMSEMASTVATLRERVQLPLIVDIDTGFGNALNVQRTVRLFERSGASALQIEDQVMPKRCGHLSGKQVISANEMVGKIKAAIDARQNEDTLIIARTDALGVNGFDDALRRADQYLEAGADALFIEAPRRLEQMQIIASRFAGRIPLVHNLVEGGKSPVDDAASLGRLGYRLALFPAALLHLFVPQAQRLLAHIRSEGRTRNFTGLADLAFINRVVETETWLGRSERYRAE
jgi:2-methylisocitrate lyase-like PEP mutase family enzyme